jgi:putative tryptophan/tyrosine transport system substrate-binding protein
MRRREFITLLGGTVVAWPLAARAQQPDRVRRIGWLDNIQPDNPAAPVRAATVQQELEKLGWVVGRNLQFDHRFGVVSAEMAQRVAAELLSLKPDVILCSGSPGVQALKQATSTVPIVFISVAEPVAQGFVHDLARPGGNITGFAFLERTVGAKLLGLLTEIAPRVKHVAYVFSPKAAPYAHLYYEAADAAAGKLGVQTISNPVDAPTEIEPIIAQLGADGGAIFNPDAFISNNIKLATDLAARYRVPAIYGNAVGNKDGLIAYTLDLLAQYRQTVTYLDRILKGEKPADLPVQQPTKFQLVINLKTAKALGLTIPPQLLATADEVIE